MKIDNFAILAGNSVNIKSGLIKYLPEKEKIKEKNTETKPIIADIRADKSFYQGTLKFNFKAKAYDTGVLLYFEEGGQWKSSIGLSRAQKSFVIHDATTDSLTKAGSLNNYELNKEIKVKIEWNGSKLKLYINEVIMCETNNFSPKFLPIHIRISSEGEVNVYDIELESIKPKIFVVMQFTEEYNKLYNEVILPISEKLGFECVRADEQYSSTPILKDIITSIEESTAIIAEITPDNPNVFYEIGYSHAIKKPTILLCDKKREKLPFDVSGFRTLFYENSIAGKSQIEKLLSKYLENIIT